MADELTPGQAGNPQDTNEAKPKAEEAPAKDEIYKKEIQGLNRKITEMEKALQSKELEKMNAEQRAAKELELATIERDRIINETISLKRQNAVVSIGLDKDAEVLISGKTDEEIAASVKLLSDIIEKAADKKAEAARNALLGGKEPAAGNNPAGLTMARAEFFALSPQQQTEFIKSRGKITD